jgi:hypothetical protein
MAQNTASHSSRETPAATKSRTPALQARGEKWGRPAGSAAGAWCCCGEVWLSVFFFIYLPGEWGRARCEIHNVIHLNYLIFIKNPDKCSDIHSNRHLTVNEKICQ